ncbi:MAG: GIY-YIG nuclease family protein [Elusimicrobiota bacterium]|nr:GIY-YIG nuclease family protein [Elusimicrobiota bacterium]
MRYVYILESINFPNTFYIGATSDLKRRLAEHNSKEQKYTGRYQPWFIKCYFAFKNHTKANAFEKYLKTSSGRSFTKKHF